MKILSFFGEVPIEYGGKKSGGAAKVAWQVSKELAKDNQVYLYPLHDYEGDEVIENVNIIRRNKKKIILSTLPSLKRIKFYFYFFKRYNFNNKLALRFSISNSILEKFIEPIIKKIQPNIIHVHGVSAERLFILESSIRLNIPTVLTSHGITSEVSEFKDFTIPENLNDRFNFEKYVYSLISSKKNNYITTVSSAVKNKIKEYYNVPEDRIKFIYNGIDEKFFPPENLNKYELRKKYKLNENKKIFLTVGTISKSKNQELVIKAINGLSRKIKDNLLYLIIGDGEEKERLFNLVKKLNLDKTVLFLGKKFSKELIEYYWLSDFFILTSLSEGMPLVYLESMAAGLPIITVKTIEGVSDLYNDKVFILSDDYDLKNIQEAIIKAINNNWDNQYISNYARKFLWKNIAKKYLELYKEVLKEKEFLK